MKKIGSVEGDWQQSQNYPGYIYAESGYETSFRKLNQDRKRDATISENGLQPHESMILNNPQIPELIRNIYMLSLFSRYHHLQFLLRHSEIIPREYWDLTHT